MPKAPTTDRPFAGPRATLAAGLLVAIFGFFAGVAPSQAAPSFENPHGDLSIACESCHTTAGWTPLRSPLDFDHGASGFDLDAGHSTVRCQGCHLDLEFSKIGSACADCHLDPHQGELGFGCESCHSPQSWDPRADLTALHDASLFPLIGAHRAVDCAACHQEDPPFEFQLTPTDCFSCHIDDYRNADFDHVELGFPTTCEDCHSTLAWQPADIGGDFDHDAFFPLRGGHAGLDCSACHTGGFGGTPSDCYACHQDDYLATTDPNHSALGFPTSCENCHSTTMWEGATEVNHNEFFPLNGVHAVLDCQECHAGGFEGTPTDCYSCHRDDYNGTRDPNHQAQGFPTECEACHNESNWNDVNEIDHAAFFPLRGAHRTLDCESCHAGGFAGTPTDCYSCHRQDYDGTTDPNHANAGFPTTCEVCHSESDWDDAVTDHSFFPLTGAHRPLDCESCHAGGFEGTPTDCVGCHRADYDGTTDPNHAAEGFPLACEVCHNTSDWDDAEFDHALWPLTGAHRPLDCQECHAEGYEGTPRDCVACHRDDYDGTNDPDHAEAGFPLDCEVCHNTSDWDDADFNHSVWPLTGQHQTLDCLECHAEGYEGTPTECVACHLDDYNSTDDPDHRAAGFPTTCEDCHNTSDWDDADFNHDSMYFPIYSGSHEGEWNSCADCHVNAGDYGVFECIFCHAHTESEMDDKHEDVSGYVWESQACYQCHPNGRE
jgi:hypothetical protein